MKIKVVYFGMIAEWKGVTEEIRTIVPEWNTLDVIHALRKELPQLQTINYAVAHNQSLVDEGVFLSDGDEIAIFPPFAGG